MQDVVEAAVERRERGRFSRSRLRDERRSRSTYGTPASVLGSILEVVYTTPPATATRSEEKMETSAIGQKIVEEEGSVGDAGKTGESNRPTAEIAEREGSDKPKLTVLQTWSVFGFATCTVPWYLEYDVEKKEYVSKSHSLQQMFCIIQHAFSLVDATMALSHLPILWKNNPSPFTYIRMFGVLLAVATRLWFTKVVFFNRHNVLEYQNAEDDLDETRNGKEASTRARRSRKMVTTSLLTFSVFAVLMIGTDFGIRLQTFDEDWKEGVVPAVIQASECYARKSYLWKDDDSCGLENIAEHVSNLPSSEIMWGTLGFETFTSAKMAQYQKFIAINTCIWMFFLDAINAMRIIQNTDRRAIEVFDFLKIRAEMLSSFIGPLLWLQLLEIATNIPDWSVEVFFKYSFLAVYIVTILTGFFSFLVLGCYGAFLAEKIKDEFGGQRGQSSRPSTPRQMTTFLFRLTRSSVGIGLNGIFVLNFGFLVAYMSVVGSFVMVLYEVERGNPRPTQIAW